ncbi:L-glyceraldehyde 3-phosphate reductase [compost metagenome]
MSTVGEKVDPQTFEGILRLAFEKGVNLIDTAENYGMGKAPAIIGDTLKRLEWNRSSYVLLSKVFFGGRGPNQMGLSLKHIRESCDKALRDLNTDYLDVFLCHSFDINTPLEETIFAMDHLIQTGKVLYWGTSNWNAEQISAAAKICKENGYRMPVAHQPCYNLMTKKEVDETLNPIAIEHGIGFTTFSPLNSGYLTGKYTDPANLTDSRFTLPRFQDTKSELLSSERTSSYVTLIKQLKLIATELECTPAQLAIAWCLKNPQVASVILGATSTQQIAENLDAVNVLEKISPDIMSVLDRAAIEMPAN